MNKNSKRIVLFSLIAPTSLIVGCNQENKNKPLDNSSAIANNQSNERKANIGSANNLKKNEEAIISILSNMLNDPKSSKKVKVEKTSNLKNDLNMDSLDLAELIMNIEDTFNIVVDVDEKGVSKMLTVADVIQYVDQHTKKK